MKKSFLITVLLGLFLVGSNSVFAQTSKTIEDDISTVTTAAITIIQKDKSLSKEDKQQFIDRLNEIANTAKTSNDKDAKVNFGKEYDKLGSNFTRITTRPLPPLPVKYK